jgi:hypothetical protein
MTPETTRRRTGEGGTGWSPYAAGSAHDRDENEWYLEREKDMIERALEDKGEMRRRDLGELLGCKYWGPGRFSKALRAAVDEGRIEHSGLGRYGPPRDEGGAASGGR